jgi:nucleotidyltransferase substrate binding protein (TIGR01987 family)
MSDEAKLSIQKLENAFSRLKEAVNDSRGEIARDVSIIRFEFTTELFWKCLEIVLANEGIICSTPRSCIKESARREMLDSSEIFLEILEDRNKAAHTYIEEIALQVFNNIKSKYLKVFETHIPLLKTRLSNPI